MPRTGLLVIDVQRDYFPGGALPLVGVEAAADVAATALARARAHGAWVGIVQHLGTDGGLLAAGTPGSELDPRFEAHDDEDLVVKEAPNAFLGTGLLEVLTGADVDRLSVVGFMSSMCVDATTRAGLDLGLDLEVIAPACAAPDLRYDGVEVDGAIVHHAFMAALQGAGASVVPTLERSRLGV